MFQKLNMIPPKVKPTLKLHVMEGGGNVQAPCYVAKQAVEFISSQLIVTS